MQKLFLILCVLLICLVLFNLSYFANSGILIAGLKKAKVISHENLVLEKLKYKAGDPRNLSSLAIDFLYTKQESAQVVEKLKLHKDKWQRRNVAMSTMGTASYLDGLNDYEKLSKKSNVFMSELFSDVHNKLLVYFQEKCPTAQIKYRQNAALPGFHIFDCNNIFAMPVASVHKDMQWNRLNYKNNENIDTKNTLSFTLALELPKGGGGLYTFEDDISSLIIPKPILNSLSKKHYIKYKVGYIVLHNGQTNHMIAPCQQSKDQYRITLQGHGVYEKNSKTWYLYW